MTTERIDVLAVMKEDAVLAYEYRMVHGYMGDIGEAKVESEAARGAVAELIETQRGCRDMLREAAKQFRLSGDNGHARHCDDLADRAAAALERVQGGGA